MKILVINPALVRLNSLGACEQDRLANVADLTARGHTVRLLTGWMPYQQTDDVRAFYADRQITADLAPIRSQKLTPSRFTDFAHLDGMAWEYAQPEFAAAVERTLTEFQPDLVWCHGSYVWSPARQAHKRGLPTVVRSVNYEPDQLLHENGAGLANRLRYAAKMRGERLALSNASALAAISPDERAVYQRVDPAHADRVHLLPLRTLPALLRAPRPAREASLLRVFFMGASFNVAHNRAALLFVLDQLAPRLRERSPGQFEFHILGSKVPDAIKARASADVIFDGYVPDLDAHLDTMDIAIAPSLAGVGMQQKVFEPLCRAFPTVTHRRALAGYAFEHGQHALLADDADSFADHLLALRDPSLRERLSSGASSQSAALFSREALGRAVDALIAAALV